MAPVQAQTHKGAEFKEQTTI
ncbi:hypothetical protein E2C01_099656 [Portunus trituberculatus]|uniref:Uncharacterized protein n=1 Tax=Portunus trituberculatus TaxID=210409 RepID=A0A5B7K4E0_PORTR|nr:hypothetical protein [Portunus trituberculatus]